jgi:hypothetical protein
MAIGSPPLIPQSFNRLPEKFSGSLFYYYSRFDHLKYSIYLI